MRIHWCGTGLSSVPGLRRLILEGHPVTVWNLPVDQAVAAVGEITDDIRAMEPPAFDAAVRDYLRINALVVEQVRSRA